MTTLARAEVLRRAVSEIAQHCPRLVARCYWAGTSAIALEELGHRESFDLDFHTREALVDTRPLLAELEHEFPGRVEVVSAPDSFGSGFSGLLELPGGAKVTIQVFAGFESVPDTDLVRSTTAPLLLRVALHRYLADKIQCVVERLEARAPGARSSTGRAMKRTHRFVEPAAVVACTMEGGDVVELPVFGGILKHPDLGQLTELLRDAKVARKYAELALRKAPWSALRRFPRRWLIARLDQAVLPAARRRALEFLLRPEIG